MTKKLNRLEQSKKRLYSLGFPLSTIQVFENEFACYEEREAKWRAFKEAVKTMDAGNQIGWHWTPMTGKVAVVDEHFGERWRKARDAALLLAPKDE